MAMSIAIPATDHHNALRNVRTPGGGRLLTWDVNKRAATGQHMVGYAFWPADALDSEPLFLGDDCGVAPSDAIDSDAAMFGVLGWLVLKPGDTDAEFFEHYTAAQLGWCTGSEAEEINMYCLDASESFYESPCAWDDDGVFLCDGKPVLVDL